MLHALLLILALPACQTAQAEPPDQALLFKSGQAFLRRSVPLEPSATTAELDLPPGVHGTIWLGSPSHTVLGGRASWAERTATFEADDLVDMLRLAVGKQVSLWVDEDGVADRVVRGVVTSLLGPTARIAAGEALEPYEPNAVVVSTSSVDLTLPLYSIVGVSFAEQNPLQGAGPWICAATVEVPTLEVDLGSTDIRHGPPSLLLSYMANGLAWTPSYVLDLRGDNRAKLIGKAVVVNDLEDMVETDVGLVVGFPNIQFAGVQSSLLPEVTLQHVAAALSAGPSQEMDSMSNVWMVQRAVSAPARGRSAYEGAGGPASAAGESSEDLYIYRTGPLTLAKGERAYVPLVSEDVIFAHRYDWELPDQVDSNARFRSSGEHPPVWHVLTLENETGAPWTTAPVLITNENGPLAQSSLDYTPIGGEATVRLTQALNLVGQSLEYRADDAQAGREEFQLFGRRYELVLVKGSLELANHGEQPAPLRITKNISGDLQAADHDPKVQGRAKSLGRVNASRTITWEFTLEPGATWEATYEYRVLIRR